MTPTPKETDPQWPPRVFIDKVGCMTVDGKTGFAPWDRKFYLVPAAFPEMREYLSLAESEHLLKKQAEKYEARIAELEEALRNIRMAYLDDEDGVTAVSKAQAMDSWARQGLAALSSTRPSEGER